MKTAVIRSTQGRISSRCVSHGEAKHCSPKESRVLTGTSGLPRAGLGGTGLVKMCFCFPLDIEVVGGSQGGP